MASGVTEVVLARVTGRGFGDECECECECEESECSDAVDACDGDIEITSSSFSFVCISNLSSLSSTGSLIDNSFSFVPCPLGRSSRWRVPVDRSLDIVDFSRSDIFAYQTQTAEMRKLGRNYAFSSLKCSHRSTLIRISSSFSAALSSPTTQASPFDLGGLVKIRCRKSLAVDRRPHNCSQQIYTQVLYFRSQLFLTTAGPYSTSCASTHPWCVALPSVDGIPYETTSAPTQLQLMQKKEKRNRNSNTRSTTPKPQCRTTAFQPISQAKRVPSAVGPEARNAKIWLFTPFFFSSRLDARVVCGINAPRWGRR